MIIVRYKKDGRSFFYSKCELFGSLNNPIVALVDYTQQRRTYSLHEISVHIERLRSKEYWKLNRELDVVDQNITKDLITY